MKADGQPETLMEAVTYFTADVCFKYMVSIKWPDGNICCPKCGSVDVGIIASRRLFQCKAVECRKQFSVKVGTIFEDSPLPLEKWLVSVWCITNAKNGISSCELARAIGITQKSAWHVLHRIRTAMGSGSFEKFTGTVESDETYIGGKARNMHLSRRQEKIHGTGGAGKAVVHGLIQRGDKKTKANKKTRKLSKVKAVVVENAKAKTLLPIIEQHVQAGSTIYTDSLPSYNAIKADYVHDAINHAEAYVRGAVHTNGMENFWSLLKRTISGTYVSVDEPHLGRYVDEQAFRFNERGTDDAGRFALVMPGVVGKRLTYKELIGQNPEGRIAGASDLQN
jgi:transposase-like protein